MALVHGNFHGQLLPVFRDHRLRGTNGPANHCLSPGALNLHKLGRHVRILFPEPLLGNDLYAIFGRNLHKLLPSTVPESVRDGRKAYLFVTLFLHEGIDSRHGVGVGLNRVENPPLGRLNDLDTRTKSNIRYFCLFYRGDCRQRRSTRQGTDNGTHVVFLDKLLHQRHGQGGLSLRVVNDQIQRMSVDSPRVVHFLLDHH